jgi:hypothetical protein
MYKEFSNLKSSSHCGLLCVLDSSPCDLFMVVRGSCFLGSIMIKDEEESLDEAVINTDVLEENSMWGSEASF